jgi:hypothetical protein
MHTAYHLQILQAKSKIINEWINFLGDRYVMDVTSVTFQM